MNKYFSIALFFRGEIVSVLRGNIMILLLAVSTLSFSQIRLTERQYSRVKMGDEGIGKYETKQEALNIGFKLKKENPDQRVIVQMYDTQDFLIRNLDFINSVEIDTITVSRMSKEIGGWLDYTDAGAAPSDLRAYLPFIGIGLIEIQTDTIYNWQKDYKLERVKKFGEVIYKNLDIPFQFVTDTLTMQPASTSYRWQTFATKQHCIKTYVDNIYTGDADTSCEAGTVDYDGRTIYRHTNNLDNLDPDTEYQIRVEGVSETGEFNIIEFKIRTSL